MASQEERRRTLDALKSKIAGIEGRPPLAEQWSKHVTEEAAAGMIAVPAGLLQEVHAASPKDVGAAEGFALAMASSALKPNRQAIVHLQLTSDDRAIGIPYGPGLLTAGIDPARFTMVRVDRINDLLWAMEESAACQAVGAIVASIHRSHKALDFTATRRLSMRAADHGCSIFLVNHHAMLISSAATLRWEIAPAPSQPPEFDDRGVGLPRWHASLRKGRLHGFLHTSDVVVERQKIGLVIVGRAKSAEAEPEHHVGRRVSRAG